MECGKRFFAQLHDNTVVSRLDSLLQQRGSTRHHEYGVKFPWEGSDVY
jgi:hypothetical protein